MVAADSDLVLSDELLALLDVGLQLRNGLLEQLFFEGSQLAVAKILLDSIFLSITRK